MKLKMMIIEDFREDRVDVRCHPIPTGQYAFDYWLFVDHLVSTGSPEPYQKIVRRLKLDYGL